MYIKSNQSDTDLFSIDDGAQTDRTEQQMTSPQNGDGQGSNPKPGNTGYRTTPFGQQGHYDEHIQTPDAPFGEDVVDENHANNAATIIFDKFIKVAQEDDQNNFLRSTVDSTNLIDKDGQIPQEDMVGQQIQTVKNNTPHQFSNIDNSLLNNPKSFVNKDQSDDRLVDIAPRNYPNASEIYNKFIVMACRCNNPNHGKLKSFMEETKNPHELEVLEEKSKQDFGTGDITSDNVPMAASPFVGNIDTDEARNYGGVSRESSLIYNKFIKSDYTQVVPSANVESGPNKSEAIPGHQDGKEDSDNESDKLFNDPNKYGKTLKYDTVEDTDDYFKYVGTSGEFGQEGDGTHSGVSN